MMGISAKVKSGMLGTVSQKGKAPPCSPGAGRGEAKCSCSVTLVAGGVGLAAAATMRTHDNAASATAGVEQAHCNQWRARARSRKSRTSPHPFQGPPDHAAQQVGLPEPRQLLRQLHKIGQGVVLQDLPKQMSNQVNASQRLGRSCSKMYRP